MDDWSTHDLVEWRKKSGFLFCSIGIHGAAPTDRIRLRLIVFADGRMEIEIARGAPGANTEERIDCGYDPQRAYELYHSLATQYRLEFSATLEDPLFG